MDASGEEQHLSPQYPCPECEHPVAAPTDPNQRLLECPACGAQFFIGADEDPSESQDDSSPSLDSRHPQRELSDLHIRQVRDLRRAANRTRGWFVGAAIVCVVIAAQLGVFTEQFVSSNGWKLLPIGFLLAALAVLMLGAWFVGRAIETTRQIGRMVVPEPSDPPDFSNLSDGSQHWKNLEEMNREGE